MTIAEKLKGKVIVSSQAMPDEPFYEEGSMISMMKSAVAGGAGGLRLAGARDVRNAKKLFDLPVIGITKPDKLPENWESVVYITPTLNDIKALADAGADIIAFDATLREREVPVDAMIEAIHALGKLAMADIATYEEGVNASNFDVDFVSTTLSGYTQESLPALDSPDYALAQKLVKNINTPVILEGRIWTPEEVKKAFEIGVHCVVIGSAITRPHLITKRFVNYK